MTSHRTRLPLGMAAVWVLTAVLAAATPANAQNAPAPAPSPAKPGPAEDSLLGGSAEPNLRGWFFAIEGDDARFREDFQSSDSYRAGLDESLFSFKNKEGALLRGSARLSFPDDYGFDLKWQQEERGWVHIKADTHPHYFDDVTFGVDRMNDLPGGPGEELPEFLTPHTIKSDLVEHIGDIDAEVGITMSGLPKFILGYSHRTRTGNQSLGFGGTYDFAGEWNRYPQWQDIDYTSDRFYATLTQQFGDFELSLRPQYEIFVGEREYTSFFWRDTQPTAGFLVNQRRVENAYDNRIFSGALRLRGDLVKDKLHLDLGYAARTRHNQNNVVSTGIPGRTATGTIPAGSTRYSQKALSYLGNTHNSNDSLHRADLTLTCTAWEPVVTWVGVQYRNGMATNHSHRIEDGSNESDVNGNQTVPDEMWNYVTANDEEGWAESLGFAVRGIDKTKIVGRLEMEQIEVDYDWNADFIPLVDIPGVAPDDQGNWAWIDTGSFDRYSASLMVNNKSIDGVSLQGKYKYTLRIADHEETLDYAEIKPSDPDYAPGTGTFGGVIITPAANYYPGRIGDFDVTRHHAYVKAEWQATDELTVAPRLEFGHASYERLDDVVPEIGTQSRWTYGLEVRVTPMEGLVATADYHWTDARTWTRSSSFTNTIGAGLTGFVSDGGTYRGALTDPEDSDSQVLDTGLSYTIDSWVLRTNYQYTTSNWLYLTYRHYVTAGVEYQATDKLSVEGMFGWVDYWEQHNLGINDYDGPLGMVSLTAKF